MTYSDVLVAGVPLIVVVIGLTEWLKSVGVSGKWLPFASMLIGLVFGVSYQQSISPIQDFATAFAAIVYGVGLGLVGSGLYDAVRSAAGK